MAEKLTPTQREAMERIVNNHWHSFGSGFGSYRVALRALHHRAPHLVLYEAKDEEEYFKVTEAGRRASHPEVTHD